MKEFQKIAVVGLGLIGGSMAKTIKKRTSYEVYGVNRNREVSLKAKEEGVLDGIVGEDILWNETDLIILGLYPDTCIEFVLRHLNAFKKGAVIVHCMNPAKKPDLSLSADIRWPELKNPDTMHLLTACLIRQA